MNAISVDLSLVEGRACTHIVQGAGAKMIHIATVQHRPSMVGHERRAKRHARLFAIAPQLLAELQRVYDALGGECFDWAPVRAVLAEAAGEQS